VALIEGATKLSALAGEPSTPELISLTTFALAAAGDRIATVKEFDVFPVEFFATSVAVPGIATADDGTFT